MTKRKASESNEKSVKIKRVKNNLYEKYPSLFDNSSPVYWDENNKLDPINTTSYSQEIAMFICNYKTECGCQHKFSTKITNITTAIKRNKKGCPFCSVGGQKKFCFHNSFEGKNPHYAKLWHPTLNGNDKASDYLPNANIKKWFLCQGCSHC